MTTQKQRNDFIGFILDAEGSAELTKEFLAHREPQKLYDFFKNKGYDGIPLEDCADIIAAGDRLGQRVEQADADGDCEKNQKY